MSSAGADLAGSDSNDLWLSAEKDARLTFPPRPQQAQRYKTGGHLRQSEVASSHVRESSAGRWRDLLRDPDSECHQKQHSQFSRVSSRNIQSVATNSNLLNNQSDWSSWTGTKPKPYCDWKANHPSVKNTSSWVWDFSIRLQERDICLTCQHLSHCPIHGHTSLLC